MTDKEIIKELRSLQSSFCMLSVLFELLFGFNKGISKDVNITISTNGYSCLDKKDSVNFAEVRNERGEVVDKDKVIYSDRRWFKS